LNNYKEKINLVYRKEMVSKHNVGSSKSPNKPRYLLEFLAKNRLDSYFTPFENWEPFTEEDFYLAHTKNYVDSFFAGIGTLASSNGLKWNSQFADSVRYTNASLYYAIEQSVIHPEIVQFSPTSGFHHANPDRGSAYCTFSGQVIASIKIYNEYKLKGAYIDLDGHFGNSIDDSKSFVKNLNEIIIYNINPSNSHATYLKNLAQELSILEKDLLSGNVNYVVFCHGADSHEWDDLGSQCTTEEWIYCSELVYTMIKSVSEQLNRNVPLTLSLFGGYRDDDYNSVLSLHTADLCKCLDILCGQSIKYKPVVQKKNRW
jgi:acetoin utilization deacetylase AcuC-like enzyme